MNESKPAQYTPQNPVYPGYGAPQNPIYPGAQTFDAPKPYPQQGAFQSGAYPVSPPAPRVSATLNVVHGSAQTHPAARQANWINTLLDFAII